MADVVDISTRKRPKAKSTRVTKPRKPRELKPFTVPHFREWAKGLTLDNGEPWIVEKYFEAFLEDVFAGFKICWLVVPEENAKTTSVAGLALYVAEFRDRAYIPVAASSRDQAEWMYRQGENFVIASDIEDKTRSTAARSDTPHLFRCLEGYRRIRHDANRSRIQVFSSDDRSGDGIIPGGLCLIDELHRHENLGLYRTWSGKLRKRGAQLLVTSTAGEVGGEFEEARSLMHTTATRSEQVGPCCVRSEKVVDGAKLQVIHDWSIPPKADPDDLELVLAANPFSGVTMQSLVEKHAISTNMLHWTRLTCNRAARAEDAAIAESEWLQQRTDKQIPVGEPIWAGLDVAWKLDTTALVPLWVPKPDYRLLGDPWILEPPRDGTSLDSHKIEAALQECHDRNPIAVLVMDTSKAEQLAQWAEQQFDCLVVDRQQTNPLAVMDYDKFMEALRKRWLWHRGHPVMTQHVMNAKARLLPGGDSRFDRPVESRRGNQSQQRRRVIDALTAACLAHTAAAEGPPPKKGVGFNFG